MSELNDSVIDLELIWGRLVDEIRDQLLQTESPEARFLILELFLLRHVRRSLEANRLIMFAVHQLQHSPQFLAIRDLANTIGITQKHLISQFEKVVGLRPKSFARICKFQRVLTLIEQQNKIEWSAIAYDCGYYDQARFIKEFHTGSVPFLPDCTSRPVSHLCNSSAPLYNTVSYESRNVSPGGCALV